MTSLPWLLFTAVFLVGATVFRLFLGVDFTDEAHYLAMALKFLRGQNPFVDELVFHQTSALLIAPFLKSYYQHFGTEGIVLYARVLFFLLNLILAVTVYFSFQKYFSRRSALIASGVALAYIPLHIPALSYNSLASVFFTLGILGLLTHLPMASGFCFGICFIVYPQITLAGIVAILLWKWWNHSRGIALLLKLGFGFLPLMGLGRLWLRKGGKALEDVIVYGLTAFPFGGGLKKLSLVIWHTLVANPSLRFLLVCLMGTIAILVGQRFKGTTKIFWGILPLLVYWSFHDYLFSSNWFFLYFSLLAPVYFWLLPSSEKWTELFWVAWFPSVIAGTLTAYASSSSAANAIIGLMPAMLVTTLFWSTYVGPRFLIPALPALLLVYGQFHGISVYRDGATSELTERVSHGPYAGLYTTPQKIAFLNSIEKGIQKWQPSQGRVLFYEFPAGYLMTHLTSAGRTSWMRTVSRQKSFYVDYYRRELSPTDLVFTMKRIESGVSVEIPYDTDDELMSYLIGSHEKVFENSDYIIWRPKPLANSLAEGPTGSVKQF